MFPFLSKFLRALKIFKNSFQNNSSLQNQDAEAISSTLSTPDSSLAPTVSNNSTSPCKQERLCEYILNEAAQDHFLSSLFKSIKKIDSQASQTGRNFISFLCEKANINTPFYDKIDVKTQFKNTDIIVEINKNLIFLIEDKVDSVPSNGQLERYTANIENDYPQADIIKFYIKTGNISRSEYKKVKKEGYVLINRTELLAFLGSAQELFTGDESFQDFLTALKERQFHYENYQNIPIQKWRYLELQAFLIHLETHFSDLFWYSCWEHSTEERRVFNYADFGYKPWKHLTSHLRIKSWKNKNNYIPTIIRLDVCLKNPKKGDISEEERREYLEIFKKTASNLNINIKEDFITNHTEKGSTHVAKVTFKPIKVDKNGTLNMEETLSYLKTVSQIL